jgi:hypothetical protein
MGGRISVGAEPDRTVFILSLPAGTEGP